MMKLLLVLTVSFMLVDVIICCGGGGGGGNFGVSNGGVTYTFKNGVSVTGSGSLSPPSGQISVTVPFRKRRSTVEDKECNKCLKIRDFSDYNKLIAKVEEESKAELVFKAEFQEKDMVKSFSHTSIAFKVIDIYKTSTKNVKPGEILSIDADLAYCKCFPSSLKSGMYIITGKKGKDKKLHLDGDFIKM